MPMPANCGLPITSGTAAKVAVGIGPATIPSTTTKAGINQPVIVKGSNHIAVRSKKATVYTSLREPMRSEIQPPSSLSERRLPSELDSR